MAWCPFKEYSTIFGKPNEGIHSYRIFDLAIMDIIFTIIGVFIISIIFKLNFLRTLIITFILGIILHRLFCVNTKINTMIFGNVS
jgi:hypothetical protein